jgi:hypothetical protein
MLSQTQREALYEGFFWLGVWLQLHRVLYNRGPWLRKSKYYSTG